MNSGPSVLAFKKLEHVDDGVLLMHMLLSARFSEFDRNQEKRFSLDLMIHQKSEQKKRNKEFCRAL